VPESPVLTKQQLREQARAARQQLSDRGARSHSIIATLRDQPEYRQAECVLLYISVRAEVETEELLASALEEGKRVLVPYCRNGELELFPLRNMEELTTGAYGIPEPAEALRADPARKVADDEVELVVVPGVAFDPRGARCGHGKGYYDKLLSRLRRDTPIVALAFDCQLFPKIPTEPHDILMDKIVTESRIYGEE